MRGSKTVFLLFCVLLLGGYIWFVERNRLSLAEQKAVDRQAFDLSMDRVDRIGIRTSSLEVEMVFDGTRWILTEPEGARASQPVVHQLLARFRNLSRGEFITPADMRSRSLTLADFGLEVPRMILTLGVEDERRVYSVGSTNPLETALYVKEESSQNVMLISSDLLSILPPDVSHFRDPDLFSVSPSEVQEIALVSSQGTVRLEREGDSWWLVNPTRARSDNAKVNDLLQKLSKSRIEAVVNRPGPDEMEAFHAAGHVDVLRLWAGTQPVPIEIEIGGTVPGNADRCYARIVGLEGLVEVSRGLRVLAQTPSAALRDRSVLSLPPNTIHTVEITDGDDVILLKKQDSGWHLQEPLNLPASGAHIQRLITQWHDAMVESFLSGDKAPEPSSTWTVSFQSGEPPAGATFTVVDNQAPPGRAFVKKSSSGELLQVVPDVVKFFPRDALFYVSKQIVTFDPSAAVRISVEHQGDTFTVSRTTVEASWSEKDGGEKANDAVLLEVLNTVSRLAADAVMAYQPDAAADPDYLLSIGLGGKHPENITLALTGSMIWVQGREVVYAIPAGKRGELLNLLAQLETSPEGSQNETEATP